MALGDPLPEPETFTWAQLQSVSFNVSGGGLLHAIPIEKLGLIDLRTVETDVLSSNEVLASWCVRRDLELQLSHTPGTPSILRQVTIFVANGLLPDLEPVTITLVLLDIARRRLGHDCGKRSRVRIHH